MDKAKTKRQNAKTSATPEPARDLSRDEILEVACRIIDRVGVDGFTMRKLAEELNRSTMASYRHVNNKDDLLVAAADQILGRVVLPSKGEGPWTDRFHELAMAVWAEIETARWIPGFLVSRQITTPNLERILHELTEIVNESGLPPDKARQAVVMAWTYTIGLLSWARDPGRHLRFGVDVIVAGLEAQH
jgi:AcrR family transcriptional regulator